MEDGQGDDAREQSNVFLILTQSEGKAHQQQLIKVRVLRRRRGGDGGAAVMIVEGDDDAQTQSLLCDKQQLRPKKICAFTVTRPTLIFSPDPKSCYCILKKQLFQISYFPFQTIFST